MDGWVGAVWVCVGGWVGGWVGVWVGVCEGKKRASSLGDISRLRVNWPGPRFRVL